MSIPILYYILRGYKEIAYRKTDGKITEIHYRNLYKFGVMDGSWLKLQNLDEWIEENEPCPIKQNWHYTVHKHMLEMVLGFLVSEEGSHQFLPNDKNGKKDFSDPIVVEDSLAKAHAYTRELEMLKTRMVTSAAHRKSNKKYEEYAKQSKNLQANYIGKKSIDLSAAIKKFEKSEFAREYNALLRNCYENNLDVSQGQWANIIKYVKLTIAPKHGNRAGILNNVTLRNYMQRQPIKSAIFRALQDVPQSERPAMEKYLSDDKTEYWNDDPTQINSHFPLKSWHIGNMIETINHKTGDRFKGFLFLSERDIDTFRAFEDLRQRHFSEKPWIDNPDKPFFVSEAGNKSQAHYCQVWDEIQGTSGTVRTDFRKMFTDEISKTSSPTVKAGRTYAQANLDKTAEKSYLSVQEKLIKAAQTTSVYWEDKSAGNTEDYVPIEMKLGERQRIDDFNKKYRMQELNDRREFQIKKDRIARPRNGALVTSHTKNCLLEVMAEEITHPRPIYSNEGFLADFFLKEPKQKTLQAREMIIRMLDVAVEHHPPELKYIRDHMISAVQTIAANNMDSIPDSETNRAGMYIWLQKAEYKFCCSLLQQIRSMVKQGAQTANLRCLMALAKIRETTGSDSYLLNSKLLKTQVITHMNICGELQGLEEDQQNLDQNDNKESVDQILAHEYSNKDSAEEIVAGPSRQIKTARRLFDGPSSSITQRPIQTIEDTKPSKKQESEAHRYQDPVHVKCQGNDGVNYNIAVASNTPIKVRPSKKARTSTHYNEDSDVEVVSCDEPMVLEVQGEDGTEYSIPVAPGTPVKMEKSRNIGKKEKLVYLEKVISGLPNPLGTSRAALQSLVESGVMNIKQYNERSYEAHVNLMWRKNGHPDQKEGGFRLAITEVSLLNVILFSFLYMCTGLE